MSVYDVFHGHPPLQGAMSATADASGVLVHHPGPLQYYLLAPVVYILGGAGWTLAVASGLLSGVLVCIAIGAGYELAGRWGGLGALGATATVGVVGGLDTYIRSFNPLPRSLAVIALLFLVALLLRRRTGALPWFIFVASLITQTHLSGLPFMAVVVVPLTVIGLVRWWQTRRTIWPMRGWIAEGNRRRAWVWTCWGVFLACWCAPALELLVRQPNNLTQVWRFTTSSSRATGTKNDLGEVLLGHLSSAYPFSSKVGRFASPYGGFLDSEFSVLDLVLGAACLLLLIGVAVVPRRFLPRDVLLPEWLPTLARASLWFQAALVVLIYLVPATNHQVWNYTLVPGVLAVTWWAIITSLGCFVIALIMRIRATDGARRGLRGDGWGIEGWRGRSPVAARALVVIALCLSAAPLIDGRPSSLHAGHGIENTAQEIAADLTRAGAPPRHVNLVGVGFMSIFDIAPAVGYELRRQGLAVHLPSFFVDVEDTEFRKGRTSPPDSVQLILYDPGHQPDAGEHLIGGVETSRGTVRIYFRPTPEAE
ncbi:hypothetical protein [Janibacter sp. LM]|uniref:hypothetical protein n=1 Tax=Janibacter sp. LM TaxID=3144845 RepID=UPI0031F6380E